LQRGGSTCVGSSGKGLDGDAMDNREGGVPGDRGGAATSIFSTPAITDVLAMTEPRRMLDGPGAFCWNWDMSTLPPTMLTRFIIDFMLKGARVLASDASFGGHHA